MAKGHKTCPKCNASMGARVKVCECGYSFFRVIPTNVTKEQVKKEINYAPHQIRQFAEKMYTNNICCHGLEATSRILKEALRLAEQEEQRRKKLGD